MSRLLGSPPAQPKRREGSIDATSRPRVHSRHPARFPPKGSLEFLSQPFLFYTWLGTGPADCKMKAREGGLRSEVHLFGLFLPHRSEDTCRVAAPEPSTLPAVMGWQSMEGPAPGTAKQPLCERPCRGRACKPWLPSETSQVSCFGHMDCCPLDTDWGKPVTRAVSSLEMLSWTALKAISYALSKT